MDRGKTPSRHVAGAAGNAVSLVTEGEGLPPRESGQYKDTTRTMALAWCAMSLMFPDLWYLQDLDINTFTTFAEYVLATGAWATWAQLMDVEFRARKFWWKLVDMGFTLNQAILISIGQCPTVSRARLFEALSWATDVVATRTRNTDAYTEQPIRRQRRAAGRGKGRGRGRGRGQGKGKGERRRPHRPGQRPGPWRQGRLPGRRGQVGHPR